MYYILLAENSIFMDFCAVKLNGSDPGICVIVKTRSYGHIENISLDSNQNWYYLLKINRNSQIQNLFVCILKHLGVVRQIPTNM